MHTHIYLYRALIPCARQRTPNDSEFWSDDKPAVDKLTTLLKTGGARYKVYFRYCPDSLSRDYSDGSGISALLADFEAMRTAKVFIGTQSSNMGRTAFYARGRNKDSRSLDGDWGSFFWMWIVNILQEVWQARVQI